MNQINQHTSIRWQFRTYRQIEEQEGENGVGLQN